MNLPSVIQCNVPEAVVLVVANKFPAARLLECSDVSHPKHVNIV